MDILLEKIVVPLIIVDFGIIDRNSRNEGVLFKYFLDTVTSGLCFKEGVC